MASPNNFNFPFFSPPPPRQPPPPPPHFQPPPPPPHFQPPPPPPKVLPSPPPPPHVHPSPPPAPVPPAPSPSNHTVIIVVFVSCGGVFLPAFMAAALFCFLKKRKKKTVAETDIVHVDEHLRVKEAIVPGPHGPRAVVLDFEDDVHVDEKIAKIEKFEQGGHQHSVQGNVKAIETGPASSLSTDHHK